MSVEWIQILFTSVNIALDLSIFKNTESFQSFNYSTVVNLWVSNEYENFLQLLILLWIYEQLKIMYSLKICLKMCYYCKCMRVEWIRKLFTSVNTALNLLIFKNMESL